MCSMLLLVPFQHPLKYCRMEGLIFLDLVLRFGEVAYITER